MTEQQVRKGHIRRFMQAHYTDERLAMLLAHTQDGKLAYNSCCCFVGIPFWPGDHALAGYFERMGKINPLHNTTLGAARMDADLAYANLGSEDPDRRRILIPMIRAEQRRRELLAKQLGWRAEIPPRVLTAQECRDDAEAYRERDGGLQA